MRVTDDEGVRTRGSDVASTFCVRDHETPSHASRSNLHISHRSWQGLTRNLSLTWRSNAIHDFRDAQYENVARLPDWGLRRESMHCTEINSENEGVGLYLVPAACTSEEGLKNVHLKPEGGK